MLFLDPPMRLIVIHRIKPPMADANGNTDNLLRFALADEPIAGFILDGLSKSLCWGRSRVPILRFFAKWLPSAVVYAFPEEWNIEPKVTKLKIKPYTENVPICFNLREKGKCKWFPSVWFVISNGRFATQVRSELLRKVLADVPADVIAINVQPDLLGKREKLRLTAKGEVAGFRRMYSDTAGFAPVAADWPHHLFVKTKVLDRLMSGGFLPLSFTALLERCRSDALTLRMINVGGTVLDLETEEGLLRFCRTELSKTRISNTISQDSRFVGKILFGKNVYVGPKVIIVGPTIIGNNVKIEEGAVINSSIIGSEVCVPPNQLVQNCIVQGLQYHWKHPTPYKRKNSILWTPYVEQASYPKYDFGLQNVASGAFRTWSRLSYARCFKRIADCFAAIIVLILFIPLLPFIALAIRLTSPGPVFFKDKRQGLHGKIFNCLKFRTMVTGSAEIQEKLRIASQVDGPQFKMAHDPRISTVGRFLRETYIDEIPQFFNVLYGQMSVIGPRPSPESENTLCPFWRDARLSVRPGITGLWQVKRTRQPMKDFQEWIYYDTKYVRNLSLRMDLWICWQTTKKLLDNFISQF